MSHIVESCPLTKLNGGLSWLHSAYEDAVSWPASYGSWIMIRIRQRKKERSSLNRRSRQRERLHAMGLSICLSILATKKFRGMVSIDEVVRGLFKDLLDPWNARSWKSTWRHFSTEGCPIWIKFHRLVQNDTSTAVIWSKSNAEVEFQYGVRLREFNGMLSQSHLPHCRVLPTGEFNVTIPELHATLQDEITWRNQCHDRAKLQGVRIPAAILKIVFRHAIFLFS